MRAGGEHKAKATECLLLHLVQYLEEQALTGVLADHLLFQEKRSDLLSEDLYLAYKTGMRSCAC